MPANRLPISEASEGAVQSSRRYHLSRAFESAIIRLYMKQDKEETFELVSVGLAVLIIVFVSLFVFGVIMLP